MFIKKNQKKSMIGRLSCTFPSRVCCHTWYVCSLITLFLGRWYHLVRNTHLLPPSTEDGGAVCLPFSVLFSVYFSFYIFFLSPFLLFLSLFCRLFRTALGYLAGCVCCMCGHRRRYPPRGGISVCVCIWPLCI